MKNCEVEVGGAAERVVWVSPSHVCDELAGDFRVVLYEKSCVLPDLCGVTGEKYTMGLNFTFTNECCNTHLCNAAAAAAAASLRWTATLFTLIAVCGVW